MKKVVLALGIVSLAAAMFSGPAQAGETKYRFDPIAQKSRALVFKNLWAGYEIFQNSCKSCHSTDNPEAQFLYTESLGVQGWKRVFLEKYPKCAKEGKWAGLTDEQLAQLNDYLFANARDTYNPNSAASCG